MNLPHDSSNTGLTSYQTAPGSLSTTPYSYVALAREAGVPFQPAPGNLDPFDEWLSLMEVVQMLCPVWPLRDSPMLDKKWRL